jgi:hypothetical protein
MALPAWLLNPNSEARPPPGVTGRALAASRLRVKLTRTLETFRCARVFREGAVVMVDLW